MTVHFGRKGMTMTDHYLTSMMNQARDVWFSKVYIYWNDCLLWRERSSIEFKRAQFSSVSVVLRAPQFCSGRAFSLRLVRDVSSFI